ncbi:SelT/SelW/SelH family protein [Myceligenerans pegani]|uniref:SelT/SelW/SelH family protein n=1 Tax=Myceligenerans pegani TaxID=2776917 RepID=A0ABR9N1E1_9MICO|nr:SelT/SelW/SelH family protein [Myceligenerans sp. TRM 65318]MBE1877165.1 SelT/SelW/SelH family protein [Myceligenerans sp. TRM 65318]MBE3019436.1 SelT/SelW/SelH family protein [Myceligenerans sp. TRM 65318]
MPAPRIVITYCVRCRWLLRAQWYAAELLQTFESELGEVALRPAAKDVEAGVFRIQVSASDDGVPTTVWNRKRDGGFPDIAELKRRVRDLVAPEMSLGHADRSANR